MKEKIPPEMQSEILLFIIAAFDHGAHLMSVSIEAFDRYKEAKMRGLEKIEKLVIPEEMFSIMNLIKIASELLSSFSTLVNLRRLYSAASLARQLVEIEYLMWAFSKEKRDAKEWLIADRIKRKKGFQPFALRAESDGLFPNSDYIAHCEIGGHPSPIGFGLLKNHEMDIYSFVCDAISHSRSIYNYFYRWSQIKPLFGDLLDPQWLHFEETLAKLYDEYAVTNIDRGYHP